MRVRTAWTTAAALTLATLVGTTGVLQSGLPRSPSAAEALLASDGASTLFGRPDDYTRLETSVLPLGAILSVGPQALIFGANLDDTSLQWRRERETSSAGTFTRMRTLSATGLATTVEVGERSATMWKPGRLDLPADITDGSQWESTGQFTEFDPATQTPTNVGRYQARGNAKRDGACLVVTRNETRNQDTTTTTETWCPGKGVVARITVDGTASTLTDWSPGAPPAAAGTTWADPSTWRAATRPVITPAPAVLTVSRAPVQVGDRVVATQDLSGDLIAIDDAAGPSVVGHPGGQITAIAPFGDSVIAASTRRTLTSFNADGTWQWTTELPDVVRLPLARLGPDQLIAADLAGNVHAVNGQTGTIAWTWGADNGITAAPASSPGLIVVADDSSRLVALNSHGQLAWQQELTEPAQAVATGNQLVAAATPYRLGIYDKSGNPIRGFELADNTHELMVADGWVIRRSTHGLYGYSPGGDSWQRDITDATMVSDGHVIVIAQADGAVFALSAAGRELGRWTSEAAPGKAALCFATKTSVGVLHGDRLMRVGP